jgi:hypothetical protein
VSPHLAFRPRSLLRALTIVAVALTPAPTAHASPQTQNVPAMASQPTAPPTTLHPRGYDPYYRIPATTPAPAPAARHAAHSTASDPPTRSIMISIASTLTIGTAIATHVRRTRTRRRRTRRALA